MSDKFLQAAARGKSPQIVEIENFKLMCQLEGGFEIVPNCITGFSGSKYFLEGGKDILRQIKNKGLEADIFVINCLSQGDSGYLHITLQGWNRLPTN